MPEPPSPRAVLRSPAAFAATYLLLGLAWLWAGGELVTRLAMDVAEAEALERYKGALFMGLTAMLLYLWLRFTRRAQERLPEVEHLLHDSEMQFASLLENAPDAIVIHDKGGILYANPAFFDLFAIARGTDVRSIRLRDLVDPAFLRSMTVRVQRLASHVGMVEPIEVSFTTRHGERIEVEHASCSVQVGGRILVQSHLRDLTARNRARRELEGLNAELESRVRERTRELSEANRALESFTYSVAHDLRSPVGRVEGFAKVLCEAMERGDHAKAGHYAARIAANAKGMSDMIEALLAVSRMERTPLERTRIDTARLVANVVAELGDKAAAIVEVGELPDSFGDAALVRQVWTNLLTNAIKYSSEAPSPRVAVTGECRDDQTVFCVADNGIGFDDAEADGLFRTFHRLGNAQSFAGMGVGLSIVKRIVTRHTGRVWAQGRPGQGAQFFFALPCLLCLEGRA